MRERLKARDARIRIAAIIAAGLLILWVLLRLPSTPPDASHAALVASWLLAFGMYGLAVIAPPRGGAPGPPTTFAVGNWRVPAAVAGLTLLALILRIWHLGSVPFVLSGDEAQHGLHALRVLNGELRNPFATAWLSVPTGTFFFNSVSLWLLGPDVTAVRLPWALVGAATVAVTYCLVARLAGRTVGFAAAALLALYHFPIHFSRLGANQVADPLLMAAALLFVYRAFDREQRSDWLWTGAVCGMALYFYTGARLTLMVAGTVILHRALTDGRPFWRRHRSGLAVALGAFLLVAAPMLQYAWRFPDDFNGRINQVGIIQNGWLEREVEIRQTSAVAILGDQFARAALAFNYYPDTTVWYGLRQPLLDPVFGAIFLAGLFYVTPRSLLARHDVRLFPLVVWWWLAIVFGGMLTENPPSSMRLITLAVPVCSFIALAIWRLLGLIPRQTPRLRASLLATAIVAFGAVSLKTYFLDFTPQRRAGGPHAELATELALRLRTLDTPPRVRFVGAPWMYGKFATLPYLAPRVVFEDVLEPIAPPVARSLVPSGERVLFVFLPERAGELQVVREAFPGGTTEEMRSGADGRTLATLYLVSDP